MVWRVRRTVQLDDRPYDQQVAPTNYSTAEAAFDAAMDNALAYLKDEFTTHGLFVSKFKFKPNTANSFGIMLQVARTHGFVLWEAKEF